MADVIKFPVGKQIGREVVEFFEKQLAKCETEEERVAVSAELSKFKLRVELLKMVLEAGFMPEEFLANVIVVEASSNEAD